MQQRLTWNLHVGAIGLGEMPLSPRGHTRTADGSWELDGRPEYPLAAQRAVSPHQVRLARMPAKGPNVIPIPGTSRPETICGSAAAAGPELTDDELARLDT